MDKLLFILIIVFFFACQDKKTDTKARWNSDQVDSLTQDLQKLYQLGHIAGFGVAIVSEDKTIYAKGFGFANLAAQHFYTKNTIQNIGSVSKTFIGIALLKAQEQGKLHLDDPVNNYLPFKVSNPYHPEIPITLRHLATHTSTITDTEYYDKKAYILEDPTESSNQVLKEIGEIFNPQAEKMRMEDFLERLLSEGGEWYQTDNYLEERPGSLFKYSNVGATLAARIIEIASGTSYDTFTSQSILKPLGMTTSGWSFKDIDQKKHTLLYHDVDSPLPNYSLVTYPDGGLITSIHDLSKYLIELIKGKKGEGTLLTRDGYQELFRAQLDTTHLPDRDEENPYNDEYNSGIFMGITPGGYLGHTGGDPGIVSFMFFDPETGLGKLLMINTSITTQKGLNQFYSIWNTLEKLERLLVLN